MRHALGALVVSSEVLSSAEARADDGAKVGSGYVALGFGPTIGNAYGGAFEVEIGAGTEGSYFATIIHAMGGANFDRNKVFMPGLGLGYRGVFGTGATRFTMFVGPMSLYKAEIEGPDTYHYTTGWGRLHLGFLRPSFWGLEAGMGLGYQHHWHEEGAKDYSGFSGAFDLLYRAVF